MQEARPEAHGGRDVTCIANHQTQFVQRLDVRRIARDVRADRDVIARLELFEDCAQRAGVAVRSGELFAAGEVRDIEGGPFDVDLRPVDRAGGVELREQFYGVIFRLLYVGLIERIDLEDASGRSGRYFPQI